MNINELFGLNDLENSRKTELIAARSDLLSLFENVHPQLNGAHLPLLLSPDLIELLINDLRFAIEHNPLGSPKISPD